MGVMPRPLNRVDRYLLPPDAYRTYGLAQPRSHFRNVTCAEYECDPYLRGWRTTLDESTQQGQLRAYYVRRLAGRKFAEHRDDAGLTVFAFEAGQECFKRAPHRMAVKEPLYLIGQGDHRLFHPRAATRVPTARAFVDDWGEHQARLADRIDRG